jgi:hypothetical protein
MRLLVLLVALLSPTMAVAQGMSYLGLCSPTWDCKRMMATWGTDIPIVTGWLENTFAKECSCGEKILQEPRDKVIRVHLLNGPCLRNKRCGKYEAFHGFTIKTATADVKKPGSVIVRRFDRIVRRFKKRLAQAQGNYTCYVSPCLECDLDETARRVLFARVSRHLPNCLLVDNPYGRRCLRDHICEKHGANPTVSQPCIVDLDGIDGREVDPKKWVEKYRHCDLTYYWELWMNCIRGDFIDPRERRCNYSRKTYQRMRALLCQLYFPSSDTCSP